jgi:hypothetical protein
MGFHDLFQNVVMRKEFLLGAFAGFTQNRANHGAQTAVTYGVDPRRAANSEEAPTWVLGVLDDPVKVQCAVFGLGVR